MKVERNVLLLALGIVIIASVIRIQQLRNVLNACQQENAQHEH